MQRGAQAVVVDCGSRRCVDVIRALDALECGYVIATPDQAAIHVGRRAADAVIVAAGQEDTFRATGYLQQLRSVFSHPRYLFLATVGSEDLAIAAFRSGAEAYLREPWSIAELVATMRPMLPHSSPALTPLAGGERLIGDSAAMMHLRYQLKRVAPTNSNVLILGETGTGKELAAQLLHLNGSRSKRPFVCLNTAAIPDALMENELFGHERGAFTGATEAQPGKLAAANGGTVFLDEIGDVGLPIQAKLLRALESRAIHRLGGTRSVPLDVRVIAATNQNLDEAVAAGRFRRDLYYRLNVVRVELPPLRARPEDVPLLVSHYLRQLNRELGTSVRGLSPRGVEMLCSYHWPGNVRELRNVIEALLVNLDPHTTGIVDVPPEVMRQLAVAVTAPTSERERLLNALTATKWNKSKAARQLRCSRMTLYRKIHRYDIRAG
jgi:DNA-binding NtrC family response regulator